MLLSLKYRFRSQFLSIAEMEFTRLQEVHKQIVLLVLQLVRYEQEGVYACLETVELCTLWRNVEILNLLNWKGVKQLTPMQQIVEAG